jgi:hypothetical protein
MSLCYFVDGFLSCHVGVFRLFDVSKVQRLYIPYKHFNISAQTLTFDIKKGDRSPLRKLHYSTM